MARMQYSVGRHANRIVVEYGYKIVGWPTGVLFTNFGDVPGGLAMRRELLRLWNTNVIRFEPATPEDIANAIRDPRTVHPGYDPAAPRTEPAPGDVFVVAPLVLHPTSTHPSISTLGDGRPRQQRSDTKRPHKRDWTSRYNRARMLPRAGIKSNPYVLESAATRPSLAARRTTNVPGGEDSERASRTHCAVRTPSLKFLPVTTWAGMFGAAAATVAVDGDSQAERDDPIVDP